MNIKLKSYWFTQQFNTSQCYTECTVWGVRLFKRFGKMFSVSSLSVHCFLRQHFWPDSQWNIYETFSQTFWRTWHLILYRATWKVARSCAHIMSSRNLESVFLSQYALAFRRSTTTCACAPTPWTTCPRRRQSPTRSSSPPSTSNCRSVLLFILGDMIYRSNYVNF